MTVREQALANSKTGHCANCGRYGDGSSFGGCAYRYPVEDLGEVRLCTMRCLGKLQERLRLERQRDATRAQLANEEVRVHGLRPPEGFYDHEIAKAHLRASCESAIKAGDPVAAVPAGAIEKIRARLRDLRAEHVELMENVAAYERGALELEFALRALGVEEP